MSVTSSETQVIINNLIDEHFDKDDFFNKNKSVATYSNELLRKLYADKNINSDLVRTTILKVICTILGIEKINPELNDDILTSGKFIDMFTTKVDEFNITDKKFLHWMILKNCINDITKHRVIVID